MSGAAENTLSGLGEVETLAFLDAMVPAVETGKEAEEQQRRFGRAFRIADYTVGGREVRLNRILADLLNPRGSHGQKGTFLRSFLKMVADDIFIDDLEQWTVKPNHPVKARDRSTNRYLDIALFRHPDVAVYIECKPWAGESFQQLDDYARDLLAPKHQHQQKHFIFVPDFADREQETLTPEIAETLGNRFIKFPFQRYRGRSIIEWLETCAKDCEADNVRMFINDLAAYLDVQFPSIPGENQMINDPAILTIIKHVQAHRNYMELAFKIETMIPHLRAYVTTEFILDLIRRLETRPGWRVDNDCQKIADKNQCLYLRKATWPRWWGVCMQAHEGYVGDIVLGFSCPSKPDHLKGLKSDTPLATPADRAAIRQVVENDLDRIGLATKIGSDEWWPAFCYLQGYSSNAEAGRFLVFSGLEKMPDGRFAVDNFSEWFNLVADAAEAKVDQILRQHHS